MFKFRLNIFFLFCFLFLFILKTQAQKYVTIGSRIHQATVIPHRTDINYLKGSNPLGVEYDLGYLDLTKKIWNQYNSLYKHGISISFFNYDNKEILGNTYQIYRYIEPIYRLDNNLFFSFRLGVGLSYLNNPYDKDTNPENLTYSIGLNSYFTGNLNMYYKLNSNFHSSLSLCMNHNSNGGVDKPNLGINYPSVALGVYYVFDSEKQLDDNIIHLYNNKNINNDKYDDKEFNLVSFFSFRNLDDRLQGAESEIYDPIFGFSLSYKRKFHNIHAYNLGLEFISDYSFKRHIELLPLENEYYQNENDIIFETISLLVGHDFLFGKYSFSQNLGYYILNKSPFDGNIYQYYSLDYHLSEKLSIGSGIRVYWAIAYFPDIRIGIKF